MKFLRRSWRRLAALLSGTRRAARMEAEMAEEFETHLRLLAEENMRRGLSLEEALRVSRSAA